MLTEGFSPADGSELLEREAELAALAGLLAAASEGRGRLSLIEGPAGIGKTRLLGEVRERARAQGMIVLWARGGELERDFGFGIVRQLLEPALARAEPPEREALFDGAARLAEPVFATTPGEDEGGGDPTHAVLHGLYWLVANLAERSPLLLAIDDAHWADEPSLRFLIHLARRLDGVRAAIALVTRTGEEARRPGLLRSLVSEARPPVLRLEPLSEVAVKGVVRGALGDEAGPMLWLACHEATGGNPFLLTELLEELRREARRAGDISPVAVRGLAPARIATALLLRVGRLGRSAPALTHALAVLGARADLADAAELAELDVAEARALAASLVEAAVLEPGEPLRFVHPIVRTAMYEDMPAGDRALLHARAAQLLAARNGAPDSIAVHLLACDPAGDPVRVATLREAARGALARGAAETAVRYLRRALAEPAPESARPGLLLELGSAAARAGEADGIERMREGFDLAIDPRTRAAGGLELGAALLWGARMVDESVQVLERALESADEAELAIRIEAVLLMCGVTTASARERVADRLREARGRVERLPPEVARVLVPPVATDLVITDGTAAGASELAKRALADDFLLREQVENDLPLLYPAVWVLIHAGQLDAAEAALRDAAAKMTARGSPLGLAMASAFDAFARHRAGELASAEAAARSSLELPAEADWGIANPIAAAALAAVLVERGDLEDARALLGRLQDGFDPDVMPSQALRESRAKLRMAEGDPRGALEELLAIARWEDTWKLPGGVVPAPWRSAAALAHAALGEADAARALALEEVALARRFGAPRPVGVALCCLGLLETGERGIELLEEAVQTLERSGDRLEHARALVTWGSALRRAGRSRDARARLAEGMDLAHRCGATVLVDRAHQQLTRAGARPRRVALSGRDSLTPSELRVAEMAAEGMTNKEIAQGLFVTLRTVEMHLSNAYGKLEIRSRRDLPRALEN